MLKLFLKNVLFTVLVPGSVAGYFPWSFTVDQAPAPGATLLVAAIAFVTGISIYLWCVWDFAVAGHGTPAPIDAPTELVVRGLYRYVRNPMYVGVLSIISAWALAFRSGDVTIYGICVGTAFHLFVLLYEEPHLKRTFGVSYEQYSNAVNRWLPSRPGSQK